jgi:hypothetical protein
VAKPISDHADRVLDGLVVGPRPRQELNPGVAERLEKSGYIETYSDISPYKTHKGTRISFVRITDKGRKYLEDGI